MPKGNRTVGECAYCGKRDYVSRDHVIPRCLFQPPVPPQLITVSACDACNGEKSKDDQFLLELLAIDLVGGESPEVRALIEGKIFRAMQKGKSVIAGTVGQNAKMEPLYTNAGLYLGHYPTVPFDKERWETTLSKMVRGLNFYARGTRIPGDYVFTVDKFWPWAFNAFYQEHLSKMAWNPVWRLGTVFSCAYLYAQEDPQTTYWIMIFFERIVYTVLAESPDIAAGREPKGTGGIIC